MKSEWPRADDANECEEHSACTKIVTPRFERQALTTTAKEEAACVQEADERSADGKAVKCRWQVSFGATHAADKAVTTP